MRLLAIVPGVYDTAPSQRFRIEQWEPLLKRLGVEITYAPFENDELNQALHKSGHMGRKIRLITSAFRRRWSLIGSVRDFDAVYLLREAALLGPPIIERLLKRKNIPIVFDFDDAVFVSYRSPSNGYLSYLKFAGKTKTLCRVATHVMAGNPYLAEYARQYNNNVTVVPTTIDTEKYQPPSDRQVNDVPVVGWTGSFSTVQHLDTLRGALHKLSQREKFKLRVIGTSEYHIEGIETEALPWQADTETEDLQPIDVGIMPLPDDKWSKGKCGLKALQFMAFGIPVVCSPVGVNTDIIQHGMNGLLATTEDEWIDHLGQLLRSVDLRQRLGRAGRIRVEQEYSAVAQAPRVYEILAKIVRESAGSNVSTAQVMGRRGAEMMTPPSS